MTVPNNSGRKYCSDCLVIHSRKKSREWYTNNIRECRVRANKRRAEKIRSNPQLRLFKASKSRAALTNKDFNLDLEDIKIPVECPILKVPMVFKSLYAPSVDRIDNTKGYVKGNVQVISWKANVMKNSATNEELVKFAEWVNATLVETK